MGVTIDFNQQNTQPQNGRRSTPFAGQNTPNGDKPKSQLWLDVGRTVNGTFIKLPLGQGIDTMYPREMRGQNPEFAKQVAAENELLAALQKLGFKFQPGEERTLNLEVRLRRVHTPVEVSRDENEFVIDARSLLAEEPEDDLVAAS
jgi:hypothetical protein